MSNKPKPKPLNEGQTKGNTKPGSTITTSTQSQGPQKPPTPRTK